MGKGPDIGAVEFVQYLSDAVFTNHALIGTWRVVSGSQYRVEYSTGLVATASWYALDAITATGSVVQIQESALTHTHAFYRLGIAQQ
ncbi:MAG: hypothetical protein EOM20_18365 [Spartobacteria bacterium]|nr:hypothetical protein [Spartobacteria bacterium]